MPIGNVDSRIPFSLSWEYVDVTFTANDVDTIIPHDRRPSVPHEVRWIVVDTNSPGMVYRGVRDPGVDYLVLRTSRAGTYRLLVFIEFAAPPTVALPRTTV